MNVNRAGVPLDKNGYAPSIMQEDMEHCFLCGMRGTGFNYLARHEVFGGAYRQKSKADGLWVVLCNHDCHIYGPMAVHKCFATNEALKKAAQKAAMNKYGWTVDKFREEYGKNYL